MRYLIDTDIIIYSLKDFSDVNNQFKIHQNDPKLLSVITYGELLYGAYKSTNAEKNLATIRRLAEIFPIVNVSPSVMETFGNLKASLEKSGAVLADLDLMIASTAIVHNLVLVTNNERHFGRISSLNIENWKN